MSRAVGGYEHRVYIKRWFKYQKCRLCRVCESKRLHYEYIRCI